MNCSDSIDVSPRTVVNKPPTHNSSAMADGLVVRDSLDVEVFLDTSSPGCLLDLAIM